MHQQEFSEIINTEEQRERYTKVDPRDWANKFPSKKDFYTFLQHNCGYFLPSYRKINARFLKDFVGGSKRLLTSADVRSFNVPKYPELSVKRLIKEVQDDDEIVSFLNFYPDDRSLPEAKYFFTILGTLHPKYLQGLIRHANRSRNQQEEIKQEGEHINVSNEIYSKLENEPYYSKRRGRTLFLLKQKSKIRKASKKREYHEIAHQFKFYKSKKEKEEEEKLQREDGLSETKPTKKRPHTEITK